MAGLGHWIGGDRDQFVSTQPATFVACFVACELNCRASRAKMADFGPEV